MSCLPASQMYGFATRRAQWGASPTPPVQTQQPMVVEPSTVSSEQSKDNTIDALQKELAKLQKELTSLKSATPQSTGPAMSDSYRAFLQTLGPAPSDAPKYLKRKHCGGCGRSAVVSVPVGYQTFDFHCPNCGYSVTTNVD